MQTREERLAKQKAYREANRDKCIAYNKQWWLKNKATKYLKNLQWRRENVDRITAYGKKYSESLPWIRMLSTARKRAKEKNLPYDLTAEWAKEKWTGLCEISGQPMKLGIGAMCLMSPSLDRIDPTKGYVQSNCRFVCLAMNAGRGAASDEEFFALIRAAAVYLDR